MSISKVVLAYSGGLDTSAIVPWLKETYDCEVVAFVADVGQGAAELEGVEQKAINSGASSCYIVDLKEKMLTDIVVPSMQAGAIYEGDYLLGTALARPVIAQAQVELALELGADAVSHGCTGKGNDQVRFEGTYAALAPQLHVIAPWRIWPYRSREDLLDFLAKRNIPCAASKEKMYSRDANLWHISHEGGELEDPWQQPSHQVWTWTQSPEQAPEQGIQVSLRFVNGCLSAVNGRQGSLSSMLGELNDVAAAHGVGRIDIVENRLVGMKSRGCYETPGGTLWYKGLQGLEQLVLDRPSNQLRRYLGQQLAQVLYDGNWFTPVRSALTAAAGELAKVLTGEVVIQLYKGQATVVQRQSPETLYSEAFATFEDDEVYNQKDAAGFIRLHSLPSRIRALHNGGC
ncbi:argininosuccinate synthase [Aliidiomarina sp. Khilg15.8]